MNKRKENSVESVQVPDIFKYTVSRVVPLGAILLFSLCQVLRQRSTSLAEAQRSAQTAQMERATIEERLRGLQRAVAMLETEKKDAEKQVVRLEKDKNALRNTLDKVSMPRAQ